MHILLNGCYSCIQAIENFAFISIFMYNGLTEVRDAVLYRFNWLCECFRRCTVRTVYEYYEHEIVRELTFLFPFVYCLACMKI